MPLFATCTGRWRSRSARPHRTTKACGRGVVLLCVALVPAALACDQARTPAALSIGEALVCEEPTCFDGVDVTDAPRLGQDRKHRYACEHFWDDYDGPIPPEEQQPLEALYDQTAPLTDKWCVTASWRAQYE